MTLTNYIQDLLYRYDCVIVPNFGGFVTNKIGARIDDAIMHPPTKQLSFNSHLTHNDGLLTSHIANSRNLSFDEANHYIAVIVAKWNEQVKTENVVLDQIGSFSLNNNKQLVFEPNTNENYLLSSFGLASVGVTTLQIPEQKVIPISSTKKENNSISTFVKYAASAAIVLTLGYGGWTGYQNNQLEQNFAKQQKKIENKIQSATFSIENPLPTIELQVTKEAPKPFHIIAGAFQDEKNAQKKVSELLQNGFSNATILGKNKWGLTQVAYESFYSRSEAYKSLASTRVKDSKDAWLLVKKFH